MPKSLYIDPVKVREPGYIHFEDIPVCQYNKTIKQELDEGNYTKEDLIRIYRDMAVIRPKNPVTIGLCSEQDIEKAVLAAKAKAEKPAAKPKKKTTAKKAAKK